MADLNPATMEGALERLDAQSAPSAMRFDAGGVLAGRVAALPSAFNPPTVAHLRLLTLGADNDGAPAALLTTRNVAKGLYGAPLAHRVGMLLAAREALPGLAVLVTNAARFVDQASALRGAFPGARFDFVAGHDTLVRIFDPIYYTAMEAELEPFFHHHRLIVTNRGNDQLDAVAAYLDVPAVRPFAHRVVIRELNVREASMSSTIARTAIAADQSHPAIPPGVASYIRAHRLYRLDQGQGTRDEERGTVGGR